MRQVVCACVCVCRCVCPEPGAECIQSDVLMFIGNVKSDLLQDIRVKINTL